LVCDLLRLDVGKIGYETARAGCVDGLEERVDDTAQRVGAGRMTSTAGKTVCDSGSAPFNLQPSKHGRLVASKGKRWLVGGNDVRRTDDDPGCAGLGQTSTGQSDMRWKDLDMYCLWDCKHLFKCRNGWPMLDMHAMRLQALCSGCVEEQCEGRSPTEPATHAINQAYAITIHVRESRT
jgi:hypothetical protein